MKKQIFLVLILSILLFGFKNSNNKQIVNSKALNVVSSSTVPQPTDGCVPLLRYYNAKAQKHFLTTNPNELGDGAEGYVYEKNLGWLRAGTNIQGDVYRFYNSSTNTHCYSLNSSAPSGFALESIIGNDQFTPLAFTPIAITEYYDSTIHDYCYVNNDLTGENLGAYVSHGVVFNVLQNPE